MKKNALILCFLCVISPMFSQIESDKHLTFLDIPITGNLKTFVSDLEKKGFKTDFLEKDAYMSGVFVNKNVDLMVFTTPKTKIVHTVVVIFEEYDTWTSLKLNYNSLKERLSIKYGNPMSEEECFIKPYYEGDGYEMTAVKSKNISYYSKWGEDHGDVFIAIMNGRLAIWYSDEVNGVIKDAEENEIIDNDL